MGNAWDCVNWPLHGAREEGGDERASRATAVAETLLVPLWALTRLLSCPEESHPSCVEPPGQSGQAHVGSREALWASVLAIFASCLPGAGRAEVRAQDGADR